MKIKLAILKPHTPFSLSISGDEDWLADLYNNFPNHSNSERMVSNIQLLRQSDSLVQIKGHVSYKPSVSCSRCNEWIPWCIDERIDAYFVGKDALDPIDQELSDSDLDEYPIVNDELDIGQVIYDHVMLSLPTHTTPKADQDGDCSICHQDISSESVYSSGNQPSNSPFAGLQKLKKPQ